LLLALPFLPTAAILMPLVPFAATLMPLLPCYGFNADIDDAKVRAATDCVPFSSLMLCCSHPVVTLLLFSSHFHSVSSLIQPLPVVPFSDPAASDPEAFSKRWPCHNHALVHSFIKRTFQDAQ
jgi:hypothetical protein